MELTCPSCERPFQATPRPGNWTGGIRPQARCPHCQFEYVDRAYPRGFASARQRVVLLTLDGGRDVALEDYETATEQAEAFADTLRGAWARTPATAKEAIRGHWLAVHDTPHVWLLQNREDWGGRGWAASSPDGRSLYFLSTITPHIPVEHLQLFLAHEFGHTLCLARGEPSHVTQSSNPMRRYRHEWLVWQLMAAWGFDQIAAETWMEQNVEEGVAGPMLHATPLDWNACREKIAGQHRDIEARLTDKTIPAQLLPWLQG